MGFKKSEVLNIITNEFKKDFSSGLALTKQQYSKIAMLVSSNTAVTTYGFLGHFPKMREWIGERQINRMQAQGAIIENKLYESTVGIKRADIEDDQVGLYRSVVKHAGQSAAELPDDLVFALLKKGKETLCYDGQNFFDTDHPCYENVDGTGKNTPQKNLTVGTDADAPTFYLFDTSKAVKAMVYQERKKPEFETKFDPSKSDKAFLEDEYLWGIRARGNAGFGFWQLAHRVEKTAFTVENIMKVIAQMQSLKTDGNKELDVRPSLILVPPALEFEALQLFNAGTINGTTNVLKGRLEVMVSSKIIEG